MKAVRRLLSQLGKSAPTTFSPDGSTGTGAWMGGGTAVPEIMITIAAPRGFQAGMKVSISDVLRNINANGTFPITVANPTAFNLAGSPDAHFPVLGWLAAPAEPVSKCSFSGC